MVNFAELKAKAEKAKDVSVTKMTNTRDRYSSAPSSKVSWDPNWKRAPPTPVRSLPAVIASDAGAPPAIPRTSRPTDSIDSPALLPYTPLPPPTRATSGYPASHRQPSPAAVDRIDWVNLSAEDKATFFEWLDEFFSRYLGIEVGPGARRTAPPSIPVVQPTLAVHQVRNKGTPPVVNMATRPEA